MAERRLELRSGCKRTQIFVPRVARAGLGAVRVRACDGCDLGRRAAQRAVELFLEHRIFRSLGSGDVIPKAWLKPHNPPYWHYDVLQALLVLGRLDDERAIDGLEVLRGLRRRDGRSEAGGFWWRPPGSPRLPEVVEWGREGPSEMITLNALRVLKPCGAVRP